MKKKYKFLKPCIALLLFFAFSMLVVGCGKNGESKAQITEENIANTRTESVTEVSAPKMSTSQKPPINDQIQMEQWAQLIGDIKTALGDISAGTEQTR